MHDMLLHFVERLFILASLEWKDDN